ncbi:glycosyltransferase [Pseudoduganella chitinolytica]|uniref:Glycosyltransferase n=1 Tax=Pseudoduganella chitinolytica TaxID=34070 RepID=A0ABY8BKP5_9BURK|nr:glycosyltransferase [Pseudoduganella chitinolytica]WEF35888.1 glycosyltransferase [Pseudoduganella chitinolytica]
MLMATFNGAATLPNVLEGCRALVPPAGGWRLIVADNGSTDTTAQVIECYAGRLPLARVFAARRGKNVALNAALELALVAPGLPGDLFVFTDDDATPAPEWLLRLAEAANAQPEYAIFGGAIVPDWAATPPAWLERMVPLGLTFGITPPGQADGPVFPGLVWGANMALRRALFDGGMRFDETIGPSAGAYAMGSETQLTRRLADAGERAWFCGAARVAHHIRAHQLTVPWILERAYRFGRGQFRQACPGVFPELLGVPRWMLGRWLREAGGLLRARLLGQADAAFRHRWELACLRGYFHEAWRAPRPPRRVLITSYSGELGGMELRMAQEAQFLKADGCNPVLAIRPFPGSAAWARQLRARRVPVTHFAPPPVFEQWHWRRWNRWRAQWWGARALRRQRPDLVHVAFCWSAYGATALWLARRCALPAVISVHNTFPPGDVSAWHRPLLREAFGAVRGVYGATEAALQHFLALYRDYLPAGVRLAVIPNCVDTARFRPSPALRLATRQALGLPADALVLGAVARLSPQKRPDALVRLLHVLRPRFPDLYLVLAGSGPLELAVRQLVDERGLTGHVIFAGFRDDVETLLPAFDVHLLLSQREGFGIATIEAMACGVPAVATDIAGNADVLRGSPGGLLVPLDDEAAAAQAVASLLADPARRARMGEAGREDVLRRFSLQHVQAQVQAFYRGLV